MKNRKNRLFNWRVKSSLIIMAALIIGSLILAAVLYSVDPGDDLWAIRETIRSIEGG